MVRRVVGCLVKVGLHELKEEDFAALLRAKAPAHVDVAAWTAPASGLFLNGVRYRS
jgi:tRNA U38,U39,U40 pseudouridine synthase TruA